MSSSSPFLRSDEDYFSLVKRKIDDLRERVHCLKQFDKESEINAFCDNLESEIQTTIDSGINHLRQNEKELLEQVNAYRADLLRAKELAEIPEASSSKEAFEQEIINEQLSQMTNKIQELSRNWTNLMNQETVARVDAEIAEYKTSIKRLERRIRELTFKEKFMKFNRNNVFFLETRNVGKLELFKEMDHFKSIQLHKLESHSMFFKNERLHCVTFLSNGNLAVSLGDRLWANSFNRILIIDVETRSIIQELPEKYYDVWSMGQMPDGTLVYSGAGSYIYMWDLEAKKLIKSFFGCLINIKVIKVLPNATIATLHENGLMGVLNPYLEPGKELVKKFGMKYCCTYALEVLSNGYLVTCSCDQVSVIRIWNPNSGDLVKQIEANCDIVPQITVLSNDNIALNNFRGTFKILNPSDESLSEYYSLLTNYLIAFAQQPNQPLLVAHLSDEPIMHSSKERVNEIMQRGIGSTRNPHAFNFSANRKILAGQSALGKLNFWYLNI